MSTHSQIDGKLRVVTHVRSLTKITSSGPPPLPCTSYPLSRNQPSASELGNLPIAKNDPFRSPALFSKDGRLYDPYSGDQVTIFPLCQAPGVLRFSNVLRQAKEARHIFRRTSRKGRLVGTLILPMHPEFCTYKPLPELYQRHQDNP